MNPRPLPCIKVQISDEEGLHMSKCASFLMLFIVSGMFWVSLSFLLILFGVSP